jgi:murein L,D-transpeptidase YafK
VRLTAQGVLIALAIAVAVAVVACDRAPRPDPAPGEQLADHVVVVKSAHTLTLYSRGKVLKSYKVALGRGPIGPKQYQGDHKTPEGAYILDEKNAKSRFHLALHVSYPNAADRERARKAGRDPGGAIMIHGLPQGFGWLGSQQSQIDWTDGCIAVSNSEIEEIWRVVPVGTPIEIKP